jgi:hypothetical protein
MEQTGNVWTDYPELPISAIKPWQIISVKDDENSTVTATATIGSFHTRGEAERQIQWLSQRIPGMSFKITKGDSEMETQRKWIFAYQAAKNFVFQGAEYQENKREDLFSDDEWQSEVARFIQFHQAWEQRLSRQDLAIDDYIVSAWRMLGPGSEDDATYASIHFFGQIKSFYPDRPGFSGRWAKFRTFGGEGDCQRKINDLLRITENQAKKIMCGERLTCHELKLPEVEFHFNS